MEQPAKSSWRDFITEGGQGGFHFHPEAVLEVSKDNNTRLSAVERHVLISLDGHDSH